MPQPQNVPRGNGTRHHWLWGLFVLAYCASRLLLIPSDAAIVGGLNHDGAYIATVADQVRAGHGLVNPSHWLVFLMPEKLPMPFHNANPGYVLMVAAFSALLHCDAVHAGLVISVLANVFLLLGVFFLVSAYTNDWRFPALAATVAALFPLNFADSLMVLPDALSTALSIWALVALTRKERSWSPWLAGGLLGAAWLVRSSALLVWPAILWWTFASFSVGRGLRVAAEAFLAFVIVISPWLFYTDKVWGSPFRSDASFYLLQDYHARAFGGSIDRYWRSLSVPPTLGAILKSDPSGFVRFYFSRIPIMIHMVSGQMAWWHKIYLIPLAGLTLAGLSCVRRCWRTAEFQAGALLVFITLAVLNVRAGTFEPRYLGPALVVAIILAVLPCLSFFTPAAQRRDLVLAAVAMVCAGWLCVENYHIFRNFAGPSEDNVEMRQEYLALSRAVSGPVIVRLPYFFAYYTGGRSALSPPVGTREELLRYMAKYSVRYLALPTADMGYFYPPESLSPALQPVKRIGRLTVMEKAP